MRGTYFFSLGYPPPSVLLPLILWGVAAAALAAEWVLSVQSVLRPHPLVRDRL
jgi:hypothetical protein